MASKSLLVLFSYHHHNTEKIAKVFEKVLDAPIKKPHQVNLEELEQYDLVGFGSGIYDEKHHKSLLDLAEKLPRVTGKRAFIFSTCGIPAIGMNEDVVSTDHARLRAILESRGYVIVDEYGCVGHNTNSFLRLFGGINKGRPNTEDLKRAEEFARNLKQTLEISGAGRQEQ